MIVAIDFGITNTDIAISNGGALDFFSYKTNLPIEESNIIGLLSQIKINHKSIKIIKSIISNPTRTNLTPASCCPFAFSKIN